MNAIALILAVIGGLAPSPLSFLFPQIWGFRTAFGVGIGVVTILLILLAAFAKAAVGVDRRDCLYRFFAGLTFASSIMFAVFLVGAFLVLVFLGAALGG